MGRKRKIPLSYNLRPWYKGDITSSSDSGDEVYIRAPKLVRSVQPAEILSDVPSFPNTESSEQYSHDSFPNLNRKSPNSDESCSPKSPSIHIPRSTPPSQSLPENPISDFPESSRHPGGTHESDVFSSDSQNPEPRLSADFEESDVFLHFHTEEPPPSPSQSHTPVDSPPSDSPPGDSSHDYSQADSPLSNFPSADSPHSDFPPADSPPSDFSDPEPVDRDDYFELLKELSKDWLMVEIDHNVSKTATDCFWELACKKMHQLMDTKKRNGVKRKTPQFQQIRKILNEKVPDVNMEIGFIDKVSGELHIERNLEHTPLRQYPPSQFRKAYEIATIKVNIFFRQNYDNITVFIFSLDKTFVVIIRSYLRLLTQQLTMRREFK